MDDELKRKWVEALRSGKYRQGRKQLRIRHPGGDDSYCCLGVLCDLIAPDLWRRNAPHPTFSHESAVAMPNSNIRGAARLRKTEADELAAMNDNGMSFAEIAASIEADL